MVLGGQVECLTVVVLNQAFECPRNWGLVQTELVLSDGWDFLQHRGDVVNAVEQLSIDLEMERNLALLFFSLKFNGLVQSGG